MVKTELTNMVMIEDKKTGKVLVQERTRSWKGLSFPGGHVDNGESFVDSAIREIKEETGLDIKNLKSCGVFHWSNNRTFERYIVFLYKTFEFTGELITEMEEGRNFWMDIGDLDNIKTANDFKHYLPMFFDNGFNEAFGSYNNDEPWEIKYK